MWKHSRCNLSDIHLHYLVKVYQSKTGHIHLIVTKKGVGCCLRKRVCFTTKFSIFLEVFLVGFVKIQIFGENWLNPESIKKCSGCHFLYFLISSDKYFSDYYWRDLSLSSHPWILYETFSKG